jgi:hypothetical protein
MKTLTTIIATLILGTTVAQFPTPKNTPKGMPFAEYEQFHICKVSFIMEDGKSVWMDCNVGNIRMRGVTNSGLVLGDYVCLKVNKRAELVYEFKSDVEFVIKEKDIEEFKKFVKKKLDDKY